MFCQAGYQSCHWTIVQLWLRLNSISSDLYMPDTSTEHPRILSGHFTPNWTQACYHTRPQLELTFTSRACRLHFQLYGVPWFTSRRLLRQIPAFWLVPGDSLQNRRYLFINSFMYLLESNARKRAERKSSASFRSSEKRQKILMTPVLQALLCVFFFFFANGKNS